ncbi:PucR family transcriptional regulator [Prescottella agglutinans]|uniref:PucR family transcriptional regulator n=1 Tax=Prescottella agglutinans TaxID=1644129 RepID=UPI0024740BEF|nr:helix-turn-helix domain-containing protein [Prescottella agglutinans]
MSNASDAEQQAITAALEVASLAVSEHLSRRRVDLERRARSRAALLSDLLESGPTIAPALYQRARDAGWSLDGYHLAARAIVRGDVDLVGRRADLENALEQEGLDAVTVEQSDGWAMWVTVDSQSEASNAGGLGTLWRRVQQRLSATIPTQLGVGSVHHGAAGLARSLAEAADAARIAAGRERSGYFVQIDRLDLAQRLLAWMSTESFVPAARELLAPLEDRPELMSTLNTYLDTESSLVETAAVLGVHRNTVSDRMARIRHDLAVDLDDPDTRLALQLACRSTVRTAGARQT